MDDMDWLRAYVDELPSDLKQQPDLHELDKIPTIEAPPQAKKPPQSKPWLPRFPALDQVAALRAQFFDNGPTSIKGKTQHTMKLRVYFKDKPLHQEKPDWTRTVQLIEPAKVLGWAKAEHADNRLNESELDRYQTVADHATSLADTGEVAWVKMGHIGSKPGNQYFRNQFVVVALAHDESMSATIFVEDGQIAIDTFYPNYRSSKATAPKLHGLFDPLNLIRGKDDE